NWNRWNTGVKYSNINGSFTNGTNGSFKTSNGLTELFLFFILKKCIENESFTAKVKLLFGTIEFGHEMTGKEGNIKIRHYIKIYGLFESYYKRKIGYNAAKHLRTSVKKLIDMAESMKMT
ncbi:MAG: hypothetical protein LBJ86_06745, partial [Spirochaetaceae bacterium]|nr:hypothetical protein [Spirochaetaceae bacterium]